MTTKNYLALASRNDGTNWNLDSRIYHWNGSSFVEVQTVPTHGATDWESFTIGNSTYLAVANYRDDSNYFQH
ncbi:MAG: hypothetical protein H6650_02250 [Ardenticatenales bacterium]|nr:hypothetical protein [Ardenticatenales bacterium]